MDHLLSNKKIGDAKYDLGHWPILHKECHWFLYAF